MGTCPNELPQHSSKIKAHRSGTNCKKAAHQEGLITRRLKIRMIKMMVLKWKIIKKEKKKTQKREKKNRSKETSQQKIEFLKVHLNDPTKTIILDKT